MDWELLRTQWTAVQTQWDQTWRDAQSAAVAAWDGTAGEAEEIVRDFLDDLAEIDTDLTWMQGQLSKLPASEAASWQSAISGWRKTWSWLGAGIYPYVTTTPEAGVQGPPVVVLVVGAVGIAFAVAFWEYAASLRDEVELNRVELEARVEAMREGTTLQPSTLPKQPSADSKVGAGEVLAGIGALVALGVGVAWALRR